MHPYAPHLTAGAFDNDRIEQHDRAVGDGGLGVGADVDDDRPTGDADLRCRQTDAHGRHLHRLEEIGDEPTRVPIADRFCANLQNTLRQAHNLPDRHP